jgi:hypothetical protein
MPKFTVGDGFFADLSGVPPATEDGAFVVVADDHLIRIGTEAGEGRPAVFRELYRRLHHTDEGPPLGRIDEDRRFEMGSTNGNSRRRQSTIDFVLLEKLSKVPKIFGP